MRTLLVLLLAALALTGCGLRVDAPDPSPSPASSAEALRQREALRAAELAGVEAAGEHADLVGSIVTHAVAQEAALGGVWRAWPADDGPTPTTDPTSDVVVGPGTDGVLAWLRATAPDLGEAAAAADDGDLATLYASLAVARAVDADRLAVALGEKPALPAHPETLTSSDPALVRAMDGAAHALEELAARASAGGDDPAPLAERAEAWRRLAARLVAENGWEGTAEDPREPFYDVGEASEATVDHDLAVALITAMGRTEDRRALLDAALACALAASRGGEDLGALPGLD